MKTQLKRKAGTGIIVIASLMLLSFQSPQKNYEDMWKKVKKSIEQNLPETAEKQLDEIEKAAMSEDNHPQLLRTILYRNVIFSFKQEDDPAQAFLRYAEGKLSVLNEAAAAVLHSEIAKNYADYLDEHSWNINDNTAIDGDPNQIEMKYWDKKTFQSLIDRHYSEALKPIETLKKNATKDYAILFEDNKKALENIDLEPTLFEFLFHRIASYYQNNASLDDLPPHYDPQTWWLPEKDFVKSDLPDDDSPILKSMKLFQELIAYNLKENDEEALLYNDVKRYQFVNGILDESDHYRTRLEALLRQYAHNPRSAEISAEIASLLIEDYSSSDSTSYDNYKKAFEICRKSIADFPKHSKRCKKILENIQEKGVSFELQNTQLPNQPIAAALTYRNTEHPYYRIVQVSEKDLQNFEKMYQKDVRKELSRRKAVIDQELDLKAENDFRPHNTLIALPQLPCGQYYLLASAQKSLFDEEHALMFRFQVSDLGFVGFQEQENNKIQVMNRTTGKGVNHVKVELFEREYDYNTKNYLNKLITTCYTDANGVADIKRSDNGFIRLEKDHDVLLDNTYFYAYRPVEDREVFRTAFFTDRAIYRPGQTVYFKGITTRNVGDEVSLVNGRSEKLSFKDANWQEIATATLVTDEYGSFDGSFVIPSDRLNGQFRITASNGSITFRVGEYKRPTFEVHFDSPDMQYKLNQEVTIHGSVDAYAGFGLDDIQYSYRVVRRTHFPWRCWWWFYPTIEDEQIDFGEARTDENGRFAIPFLLKPSLKTKPELQPVFTYEITVTATNAQGETQEKSYSIRAGYNEVCLSAGVPEYLEISQLADQQIMVSNMSGKPAKSRISRKFYRYNESDKINFFEALGTDVRFDRQVLSDTELDKLFPDFDYYATTNAQKNKSLCYEDIVNIDDKAPLIAEGNRLKPGHYLVELKSLDDSLAVSSLELTLFEDASKKMPFTEMLWVHANTNSVKPGEEVRFRIGTSCKDARVWLQLVSGKEVRIDKQVEIDQGVYSFSYKATESDRGGLSLNVGMVKNGIVKLSRKSISVPYDNLDLNVQLATVRDVLTPGAEEQWEVTVRDNTDKPVAASLMAGMYDASLDVFAPNYWWFSMKPSSKSGRIFLSDTGTSLKEEGIGSVQLYSSRFDLFDELLLSALPFIDFWSVNRYYGRSYMKTLDDNVMYEMAVPNAEAMEEKASGAVLQDEAKEDDLADTGEEKDKPSPSTEAPVPNIRENFNETAFFFPNLHSNADGSTTFSFTMPDALTRWKLMMLAYTQDRKTGTQQLTFKSSKPVMIMADMPRYLYDSDTLVFVANIINTGDADVTTKAKLEIFDAGTMEAVDLLQSDAVVQLPTIAVGRSKEVRWKVAAKHDLGLLAFRFTAYDGSFSDAEQHLLPVLSSEVFMTQTLPITVKAETEKTFTFDAIANPDSHERDYSLTLNFSTNPVWYAVQSLPYLANINTNNAENAFYVFYANTLSAYIADNIPNLLNYIRKWQIETPEALLSQLEKDQHLKAIMLQETPWVLEAKSETEQRSRIANLFEINTLGNQQTESLKLIASKQKASGGWPWMEGMPESPYISTYILTGMGKLIKMNATTALSSDNQRIVREITEKAVRYLEYDVAETYRQMLRFGKQWPIGSTTLSELYALSFFKEQNADKDFATAKKYYLNSLDKKWTSFDFNMRSKGALVLHRNGKEQTAKLMIQSFKECAQKNEDIGMYWPQKHFSFVSHIAIHANIMSAFDEIEGDQEMIDRLRVWLLTQKQTNKWENSASTADAIYALLMRGSDWLAEGKDVTLRFGATPISTEGGVAGTGFIQRRWNANEVTTNMRSLTVNNPTAHLVWGGLFRQYFVPIDEVKSDESAFTIKRELFVETVTDKGKLLVPITKQSLKVGDKLTVKITFESKQDMSFVFVKDLRAAGCEPIEQVSHYEYNDRMCYYQSNTDTDMEFFIEFLPKGIHQLEYSMFVTKEGNLSNGYALIQCQYAPEFSAYSDGMRLKVEGVEE